MILEFAQNEALHLKHELVSSKEVLLGILWEGTGEAAKILKENGGEKVKKVLLEICCHKFTYSSIHQLFAPQCEKLFQNSWQIAQALGAHFVESEHLLLALLEEDSKEVNKTIFEFGFNPDSLKKQLELACTENDSELQCDFLLNEKFRPETLTYFDWRSIFESLEPDGAFRDIKISKSNKEVLKEIFKAILNNCGHFEIFDESNYSKLLIDSNYSDFKGLADFWQEVIPNHVKHLKFTLSEAQLNSYNWDEDRFYITLDPWDFCPTSKKIELLNFMLDLAIRTNQNAILLSDIELFHFEVAPNGSLKFH